MLKVFGTFHGKKVNQQSVCYPLVLTGQNIIISTYHEIFQRPSTYSDKSDMRLSHDQLMHKKKLAHCVCFY